MVEEMGNQQDARCRCHRSLSENKNNPLPRSVRLATVPDAHTQRYPEQQQQRQDHSMGRSVAKGVQPENQAQPAAEYRPPYGDTPNAKSCKCVHKSQRSNAA